MTEYVNAQCNWTQTGGNELSKAVPTRLSDEDVFIKPEFDDVVSEEGAMLFSNNDTPVSPMELKFQIFPRFKIAALTLVCSAPKVELFLGPSQEYYETIYGDALDDTDTGSPVVPFRYDIEIDRSGIADLNLKLLTSANEICIYGAMLHIAPNPNGITTQMPKSIDLERIRMHELLSNRGASTDVDTTKFEQFMALMKSSIVQPDTLLQAGSNADASSKLLSHIDAKFEQLERMISKRLDNFEINQAKKLDKILAMLESKN